MNKEKACEEERLYGKEVRGRNTYRHLEGRRAGHDISLAAQSELATYTYVISITQCFVYKKMKTFNMVVNRQHSQEAEGAKKMRLKSGRRGRHLI